MVEKVKKTISSSIMSLLTFLTRQLRSREGLGVSQGLDSTVLLAFSAQDSPLPFSFRRGIFMRDFLPFPSCLFVQYRCALFPREGKPEALFNTQILGFHRPFWF